MHGYVVLSQYPWGLVPGTPVATKMEMLKSLI